jgi:hypothetical protein
MTPALSPRATDVAIAVTVVVASVIEVMLSNAIDGPRGLGALLVAGMGALLYFRRTHPVEAAAGVAALAALNAALVIDMRDLVASFFSPRARTASRAWRGPRWRSWSARSCSRA